MIYRAAAALPYPDRDRATAGLRGQLRLMVLAGGTTPDWSTLIVEGPVETPGLHGRVWFEWSASVEADDEDITASPVVDVVPTPRPLPETQPSPTL